MSRSFPSILFSFLAARASAVRLQGTGALNGAHRPWRIKAYYINANSSVDRAGCMRVQMDQWQAHAPEHNLEIVSERFPAVEFSSKCADTESCIADVPSCFPSGRGFASHGNPLTDPEEVKRMRRGVFGDACSHLRVLQKISRERPKYDYFLVLEDDVGLSKSMLKSLSKLFSLFPDHWTMITIDSFPWPERPTPEPDMISPQFTQGLPLTGISATRKTNWGSHAWLFNSDHVGLFLQYFRMQPTMNTDWYTKLPRPLHLGIWGFNPGQMKQIRFMNESTLRALPAQCQDKKMMLSNIAEMAVRVGQPSHARTRLLDVTQNSKDVLLFGMEGTNVFSLRGIVSPALCKYQEDVGCQGVPFHLPPEHWHSKIAENRNFSEPLSQAVAVVVVRHPFALAEELYARPHQSSVCDTLKCNQTCKAMPSHWLKVICQWNSAMIAYKRIAKEGTFRKIVFLRYEDIVSSPNTAARRVAKATGSLRSRAKGVVLPLQVKSRVRLEHLRYKTRDACSRLESMCKHINREMLWQFGYHGCQWFSSNFTNQVFEGASRKPKHFADCEAFRDPLENAVEREG